MGDWQKVRVTFQDADGNEVVAVMWRHSEDETAVFSPDRAYGPSIWVEWSSDFEQVSVTPIRELPTGVGAVIRVTDYGKNTLRQDPPGPYGDLWMLGSEGWCYRGPHRGAPFKPSEIAPDRWEYEVLSEGIQIGGVK